VSTRFTLRFGFALLNIPSYLTIGSVCYWQKADVQNSNFAPLGIASGRVRKTLVDDRCGYGAAVRKSTASAARDRVPCTSADSSMKKRGEWFGAAATMSWSFGVTPTK